MPGNSMIGEQPEGIDIVVCQKMLKSAEYLLQVCSRPKFVLQGTLAASGHALPAKSGDNRN